MRSRTSYASQNKTGEQRRTGQTDDVHFFVLLQLNSLAITYKVLDVGKIGSERQKGRVELGWLTLAGCDSQ